MLLKLSSNIFWSMIVTNTIKAKTQERETYLLSWIQWNEQKMIYYKLSLLMLYKKTKCYFKKYFSSFQSYINVLKEIILLTRSLHAKNNTSRQ